MRHKFPFFWLIQTLIFGVSGIMCVCFPMTVLEIQRGELAPAVTPRPGDALDAWVLGLESIDPAPQAVKSLLQEQLQTRIEQDLQSQGIDPPKVQLWSLDDLETYLAEDQSPIAEWFAPSLKSPDWEAVEAWLLSATPQPPPESRDAIHAWIHATDEIHRPSPELVNWAMTQNQPSTPHPELRRLILRAREARPIAWRMAADHIRLVGPCILAAALFTLFGLASPSIRRPLARIFVLIAIVWSVAMLQSTLGPPQWNLTHGLVYGGLAISAGLIATALRAIPGLTTGRTLWLIMAAWWTSLVVASINARHEVGSVVGEFTMPLITFITALVGLFNAGYWLLGPNEDPPQDDGGIAQNRPPELWTVWLIQFVVLFNLGGLSMLFPEEMADLFANDSHTYLTVDIVNDAVRELGAWLVAMGLLSFFALGVADDWIWQGIGRIFSIVFALLAATSLINALSGEYSLWSLAYGFQGLIFIPVTVRLMRRNDKWVTENVENQRGDWTLGEVLTALPLLRRPLSSGKRHLYQNGVAGCGSFEVYDSSTTAPDSCGVPENDFFRAGHRFHVVARFSNCFLDDDAGLDIRGCGIRLQAVGTNETMDMLMATGGFSPVRSLSDVRKFRMRTDLRKRITSDCAFREGMAAGMRRAPRSYSSLSYFNQIVLEWLTPDSGHKLVRFRLVPQVQDSTAQGLPDTEDLEHLWKTERRPTETRGRNYLRREFAERLCHGQVVTFELQAQFRTVDADDSEDWFDATLEWDQRVCPWLPLGRIVLDTPLGHESTDSLWFNPAAIPSSIRVPKPPNITDFRDPRSLAAAQFHIASLLGWIRTWRRRPATTTD